MSTNLDADLAQVLTGHGRCSYLLLSLLLVLVVYPYCIDNGPVGNIAISIMFSFTLIAGAYAIGHDRSWLIGGIALSLVAAALHWLALTERLLVYFIIRETIFVVFLVYGIHAVLRYLLTRDPITADKLHGALAGFIMVGFLWAFLYTLLANLAPGSFNIAHTSAHAENMFYALLYFSFTTLTSVGFGDITPSTDHARSLVIIEQLAGVFFVAVLIARLAGLYPPRTE